MTGQLEARKGTAPDRILEMMGKELVPTVQANDQANVFYGVVDRRNFDLTYSGAGRVVALLLSFTTGKLQRLQWDAGPFNQNFRSDLKSTSVSLGPRDRVILCSEGVTRALNPKGETFGEDRLYKTILAAPRLGVHDLRNEIFYQVEKFAQSQPLPQDLTVVVTEVKDRVIKLAKS